MRSARPPLASPSKRNRPFRRSGSRGEGCRRSAVTINLSVSAYISVKITRRRDQAAQQGAVIAQLAGYKMHHFTFAFKHSFDAHQTRAQQFAPLALDEMRPDNDINIAGLVLERYKYRARGGARALATGDDARRPPQSETGARVVGHEVLSLGWTRQNRRSFRNRRVAQDVRAGFDSGDLPECVAAMAGERLERACSGKALQIVPVELGAAGEILDAAEQPVPTRGDNAFGTRFRQTLHEQKTESNCECIGAGFQSAIPFAGQRVHRTHFDAMPARVLHEL